MCEPETAARRALRHKPFQGTERTTHVHSSHWRNVGAGYKHAAAAARCRLQCSHLHRSVSLRDDGSVPTSRAARLSSAAGGALSDDSMGSAGPRTSEQSTIGAEAASLSEGVEGPGSLRGMAANLTDTDTGRRSDDASAGLRDVETATAAAAGQSGSYRGAIEGSAADAQEKEQLKKRTERGERMGAAYVRPQGQAAGSRRGFHTATAAALGSLPVIHGAVGAKVPSVDA